MGVKKSQISFKGLLILSAVLILVFNSPLISSENENLEKETLLLSLNPPTSTVEPESIPLSTQSIMDSFFLQQVSSEYTAYSERYYLPAKQNKPYSSFKNFPVRPVNKKGGIEKSLFASTLVSLTALNAMDFYTTNKALKYDGLQEVNPLMKPFTKNTYVFAAVKLGLTALNCYSLNKVHKNNKTLAWFLSITSNVVMSYIVYNNAKWIQRVQR